MLRNLHTLLLGVLSLVIQQLFAQQPHAPPSEILFAVCSETLPSALLPALPASISSFLSLEMF